MSRVVTKGRDKLLKAFGYGTSYKMVQLSSAEVEKVKGLIAIMEKAADLWVGINGVEDCTDNIYRMAEFALRDTLE